MKKALIVCLCLWASAVAQAAPATLVSLHNPRASTGIEIGDVLQRSLVIESEAPYELPGSALPIKGARIDGVELVDIAVKDDKRGNGHHYEITLTYQVFQGGAKPLVMRLPQTTLALTGGSEAANITVPAWHFWYSPLVVGDIHTARSNLQPQIKPALLPQDVSSLRLGIAIAVLVIGLIGLLYINAERRWLPWMGGPFAQAYRQLRKSSLKTQGQGQALGILHQAFNRVHGQTLFRPQLPEFLVAHPQYQSLAGEIDAFFQRSESLLFTRQDTDVPALIKELQVLSRRLRDAERRVA